MFHPISLGSDQSISRAVLLVNLMTYSGPLHHYNISSDFDVLSAFRKYNLRLFNRRGEATIL